MRVSIMTAACVAACVSTACSPVFNWREVSLAPAPLAAMFPCKPEQTSRTVTMGGRDVELTMRHCDTAGVTAAVGHASVVDPALLGPVLAQWQAATLASLHATASTRTAWTMDRATPLPQAVSLQAFGTSADGKPLELQAAWFAREGQVFAALLYGPALAQDVVDAFFSGLRLQ